MRIPIVNLKPSLAESREDWQRRLDSLYERGFFILGPELSAFEESFAAAVGATFAVGVSSGSSAIELSLRDADIRGEVLTSALTAAFTAVSIAAAGATPRFADIDPETLQVDADDLGNRIGKKTEALVPVHLYGQSCNIKKIAQLDRRLCIVQDACQAHGATFQGRP